MNNGKEIKFEEVKFKNEIYIGITEQGQIAIKDNLNDLVTAFGMLDVAKDIIRTKILKMQQSQIVKPKGGILNFVRGGLK